MTIAETRPELEEPGPERAPSSGVRGRLPHFPAIEGLRGLAVAAVVLFHAQFGWMQGGYLGVSTFFTLSGFLITSLLLAERSATGGVDLQRFWNRRIRRLMPASFAALALIAMFGIFAADAAQKRNLAGDVTSALAYVANWRFLFSNQSYGDLFSSPSPVLHFWSLAIEEQFYVLFPVLAWFALARLRLRQGVFALVLAALISGSLWLTLAGGLSHDAIYYNTFTRAAELLAGALLATLVYRRRVTTALVTHPHAKRGIAVAGPLALGLAVALWVLVPQTADWLYRGGFVAYAGLSAIIIVAAIAPHGPVHHALAVRPLRALGAISYGVYLFHWPVFLWLDPTRTGWSDTALFVPRIVITLLIALASYRFLETPIRQGVRWHSIRPKALAPIVAGAIAVTVLAVSITAPQPLFDFESSEADLAAAGHDAPAASGKVDTSATTAPFPRMAIFGDSTALMTGVGLSGYATDTKRADLVPGYARLGCGVGRGGERRDIGVDGKMAQGPISDECNHWERNWYQKIVEHEPNIAVVQIGPWEVADRKLEGDDTWRALGDPVYDAYLQGELDLAVQRLSADGALVVFVTSPIVGPDEQGRDAITAHGPGGLPERMIRLNELIKALPQRNPGLVQVVDLASWVTSTGEDRRLRPDGVHFSQATGTEVAERFLGDAIVKAYQDGWPARRTAAAAPTTPGTTPGRGVSDKTANGESKKVLVVGDETAEPVASTLERWGASTGYLTVARAITPDCGILDAVAREEGGPGRASPPACTTVAASRKQAAADARPDIILVVPGRGDFAPLLLSDDDRYRTWDDPVLAARATKQLRALVSSYDGLPASIIFLDRPVARADAPPTAQLGAYQQAVTDIARSLADIRNVRLMGLGNYLTEHASDGPAVFTPDGSFDPAARPQLTEWLGNELLSQDDDRLGSPGGG